MAKQDEKQRLRRRLQDYAMQMAITNNWEEAIDVNKQILELEEDPPTLNRLGKAYMERGEYQRAHEIYQRTLEISPINTIARRNVARLESLLARGIQFLPEEQQPREQVDLRFFITEAGKTAVTSLIDVPRTPAVDALSSGEKVDLHVEGRHILVLDADDNVVGRIEPKIGQRLSELINGGNRYIAAIAQSDPRQVRILIREIFRDPSQRGRTSFPGKLADASMYEYLTMRYDYDTEDLMGEEDTAEEPEALEEEITSSNDEEEEIRLDTIEKDDEDMSEE